MLSLAIATETVNTANKTPLTDSQCWLIKELRANKITPDAIARRLHISRYDVLQVLGLPTTARNGEDS